MATHTDLPVETWTYIILLDGTRCIDMDGWIGAEIFERADDLQDAVGYVIAAAPDMYAALKAVSRHWDARLLDGYDDWHKDWVEIVDQTRAALAKAAPHA